MVLIYVIAKDRAQARDLGQSLIQERLANSVNVIPGIETLRWSDEEVINTLETILLIKTKALLYSRIETSIKNFMGSDSVNMFSMPITQINAPFRDLLIEGTAVV